MLIAWAASTTGVTLVVDDTNFGLLRLEHVISIVATILAAMFLPGPSRRLPRTLATMILAGLVWAGLMALAASTYQVRDPEGLKQGIFVVSSIGPAMIARHLALHGKPAVLRVCELVPLAGIVGIFATIQFNSGSTGVTALDALRGFLGGDRNYLLYTVFQRGFGYYGTHVIDLTNIRHSVFVALAGLVWLSRLFATVGGVRGFKSSRLLGILVISPAAFLVLISLSRSAWLVLALPLLTLPIFAVVVEPSRIRRRRTRYGISAVAIVAGVALVRWGGVVYERLVNDDASYTGRLQLLRAGLGEAMEAGLLRPAPAGYASPHNLILNSIVIGGWISGAAAFVLTLLIARLVVIGSARWARTRSAVLVPLVGLAGAPLCRGFTAGDGSILPATWVFLFVAAAIWDDVRLTLHRRRTRPTRLKKPVFSDAPWGLA